LVGEFGAEAEMVGFSQDAIGLDVKLNDALAAKMTEALAGLLTHGQYVVYISHEVIFVNPPRTRYMESDPPYYTP
jgi:hypothetical protein